ncbi:MAG: hypothetical protein QG571_1122, partial [Pseudomonadota bacterium]|nr:hypothetical protein [Pseudomonadota bacterium]
WGSVGGEWNPGRGALFQWGRAHAGRIIELNQQFLAEQAHGVSQAG